MHPWAGSKRQRQAYIWPLRILDATTPCMHDDPAANSRTWRLHVIELINHACIRSRSACTSSGSSEGLVPLLNPHGPPRCPRRLGLDDQIVGGLSWAGTSGDSCGPFSFGSNKTALPWVKRQRLNSERCSSLSLASEYNDVHHQFLITFSSK